MGQPEHPAIKYLIEIKQASDHEFYWVLQDNRDQTVAISRKWYATRGECEYAINVIKHHFKNAVISEEVVK